MDSEGGNEIPGQPPYGDPFSPPGSPPPSYTQPESPAPPYSQPGSPPPPYSQPGSTPPPYGQPGSTPPPYGQPPGGTPPPYAPPGAAEGAGSWGYDPSQGTGGTPGQGYGAPAYPPNAGSRAANNKKLTIIGAAVAVVVVLIVVIVVAVGGGSSNSPTATVNGFIQAALANNGKAVCSYFPPADQAECNSGASAFHGASGSAQTNSEVTQGNEALVSVTGRVCAPFISGGSTTNDCASNSNPSAGMPGNGVSFDQAFAAALNESANSLSPVPVEELNGKWYLDSGS